MAHDQLAHPLPVGRRARPRVRRCPGASRRLGVAAGVLLAAWALLPGPPASHAQVLRGTTEDGRKVILEPGGTWRFADEAAGAAPAPAGTRASVTGKRVSYRLAYDAAKWRVAPPPSEDDTRDYVFRHRKGDAYAMVIAERLGVPLSALRDIAIANARKVAPDARVTAEETRKVNGAEVLALQLEGTIQGIPFVYYGYYYSGRQGTVQIIAYTGRNLFDEYRPDFAELLDSFSVE